LKNYDWSTNCESPVKEGRFRIFPPILFYQFKQMTLWISHCRRNFNLGAYASNRAWFRNSCEFSEILTVVDDEKVLQNFVCAGRRRSGNIFNNRRRTSLSVLC